MHDSTLSFNFVPLVSCQDKAAMAELEKFRAQAAVEEQNMALAIRVKEAWSKGDIEELREVFSLDFVFHSQTGQDNSLEDTIYSLKQHMFIWPDRTFTVEDMFVKGDKIASMRPSGPLIRWTLKVSRLQGKKLK